MRIFSHRLKQSGHIFPKYVRLFRFFEKGHGRSPRLPSVVHLGYIFDILKDKSCWVQYSLNLFLSYAYLWKNFSVNVLIKMFKNQLADSSKNGN